MRLRDLFKPGTGRRRLTAADHEAALRENASLKQRLETRPSLHQVRCTAGRAEHPVWWTDGSPGDCPWCLAEAKADEVAWLKELLGADAGVPSVSVKSPIEQGCRDTERANERTVQATLTDLEVTGEHGLTEQLLAGLRQERRPRRPTLPTDAPPPDCEATAGLPLFGHSLPVRMVRPVAPTEVSRDAANAAQASVADAMAAAP